MDLYNNLDDWYCDGDELLGENSGESMDQIEDSNSSSEETTENISSEDTGEDNPVP